MSDSTDRENAPQDGLQRARGRLRGKIRVAEDFDDLPDDIAEALGDEGHAAQRAGGESPESPKI